MFGGLKKNGTSFLIGTDKLRKPAWFVWHHMGIWITFSHALKSTLGKILKIKFLDKCSKKQSFPVTIGDLL